MCYMVTRRIVMGCGKLMSICIPRFKSTERNLKGNHTDLKFIMTQAAITTTTQWIPRKHLICFDLFKGKVKSQR